MTRFYTSTFAAAMLAAAPAMADLTANEMFRAAAEQGDVLGSQLIGARIYAAEGGYAMADADGTQKNWQDVGEIHDLVLGRDGAVDAVLVDIGGFLGIGERQVAMNMDEIRFVDDASTEATGDFFLVIPASMANLKEAPEYVTDAYQSVFPDNPVTGKIDRDRLEPVTMANLTADELTGARVYSKSDTHVGEVSRLVLDGQSVDKAVIDIGGFLGIAEKPVALDMDRLHVMRDKDSKALRVFVDMTEEGLEALPSYSM